MRKLIFVILYTSIFILADQQAITDNKVDVILKDDSTWVPVDSIPGQISPFATTKDSQIVFLKDDGTWEPLLNVSIESSGAEVVPDTIIENEGEPPFIEIVPYYKLEIKPKPLKSPVPNYPYEAKKKGIEGMTVVKMLIDTDGSVMDVEVLKSSGNQLLDDAALDAALKSKFKPAEHHFNGKSYKVRVWVSRPFKFRLN
jgi:TonB family protein